MARKRIGAHGDISLGGAEEVSIAEALGLARPARREAPKETAAPKKSDERGIDAWLASASQATLHRESAGRGGRTVTMTQLKPAPTKEQAEEIARAMRKALGCGARVETAQGTPKIALQGDIQDRASQWLSAKGVKKIVMGN